MLAILAVERERFYNRAWLPKLVQKVTEVKVPHKNIQTQYYTLAGIARSDNLSGYVRADNALLVLYLCKTLHEACRGVRKLLSHEILRAMLQGSIAIEF